MLSYGWLARGISGGGELPLDAIEACGEQERVCRHKTADTIMSATKAKIWFTLQLADKMTGPCGTDR
jgi:hypothetical protein